MSAPVLALLGGADLELATRFLSVVSRADLWVDLEIDPNDDEDRYPDSRLILADKLYIEPAWINTQTILGKKREPGYKVFTLGGPIGETQSIDEALLMALYTVIANEWKEEQERALARASGDGESLS